MSEIIASITSKPNWLSKIDNKTAVSKWKTEMAKDGVSEKQVDLAILIARRLEQFSDDYINWHLCYSVQEHCMRELSIKCDCNCNVCQCRNYRMFGSDGEEIDLAGIECECAEDNEEKIRKKRHDYLRKRIFLGKTTSSTLRKKLIDDINTITTSRSQVINIIHPSNYCFIKGITKEPRMSSIANEDVCLWLPTEFIYKTIKVEDDLLYISVPTSHINGFDGTKGIKQLRSLKDTCCSILSDMIPMFQSVIDRIYDSNLFTVKPLERPKLNKFKAIIKLAEVNLTPENPSYSGGQWQFEGLQQEKIIAVGMYYYIVDNVTKNYVNFRTRIDEKSIFVPRNVDCLIKLHYGIDMVCDKECTEVDDPVIGLAKVKARQGLTLIFPNYLQHRIEPFELYDKTKSGKIGVLTFSLICDDVLTTNDISDQKKTVTPEENKMNKDMIKYYRTEYQKKLNDLFCDSWRIEEKWHAR